MKRPTRAGYPTSRRLRFQELVLLLLRMFLMVVLAVALNVLLLFQYQVFMKGWRDLSPYPRGWYGLGLARFWVPLRVLARWFGL